ncbi:hypothetical protein PCLA_13r0040 [Pseudomonas citronellolis]|nr:hypothetical protein PCLA_13r0040 [Pseudomonas citronellolis]
MVKLTDLFKFSPDGIRVVEFGPGEHDLEGRALEVAESLGIVDDSAARAAAEEAARQAAEKAAEEEAARQAAAKAAEEEAAAAAEAAGAAGKGGAKAKAKAGE